MCNIVPHCEKNIFGSYEQARLKQVYRATSFERFKYNIFFRVINEGDEQTADAQTEENLTFAYKGKPSRLRDTDDLYN